MTPMTGHTHLLLPLARTHTSASNTMTGAAATSLRNGVDDERRLFLASHTELG
ncbi:MAG: hypothetical protein SGJ26_00680 [Nitrospirota bacterium]|nr:hypothetical protein [Nitrospirota bacterium]